MSIMSVVLSSMIVTRSDLSFVALYKAVEASLVGKGVQGWLKFKKGRLSACLHH
jgi:hypothetical protein